MQPASRSQEGGSPLSSSIIAIIQNQSGVLLENLQVTLEFCSESLMEKSFPDWPIWKQFYHMLHSLDQWFIDPSTFMEPSIHQPYFRTSDKGPGKLTKEQLLKYFAEIRSKIETYLAQLSIAQLEEPVGKGNLTRLDLILSQFRHVMHHVGYLHCAIKSETGESPQYIGLRPQV